MNHPNPYKAPLEEESLPKVVPTRARVLRELMFLVAYFSAMIVLPFVIAWGLSQF